jgi:hypothetical protein
MGLWLSVGGSEVVTVPDVEHAGFYATASVMLSVETGPVWLIPSLGVEVSPDLGNGGATASLTVERAALFGERVAGDVILSLIHDQHALEWDGATLSYGVGAGVSITVGSVVLSPALYVYRTVDVDGWTAAPTVTLAFEP